jgi:lipopolysaccharide/colanic/teichoic acid biosynthesis glycosyltransferase
VRILFVTQWFDPEPTFKGVLFAREMRRLGHDVTVLTGFPNYPGGKLYPGYKLRLWQHERLDGVDVLRVPLYPDHSKSVLGRIANYASFACTSSLAAIVLRRPDVVYAYHPPGTAALAPLILKWFKGAPFVLDVQDLWPDTLAATGMLQNRTILGLVGRMMRMIYAQAAHIVVLSPGFARLLQDRGTPAEKMTVIPNWSYATEASESLNPPARPADRTEERQERGFELLFAGNMGIAQKLDTVLDAARLLMNDAPDVRITFVGSGVDAERLRTAAESTGITNVRFLPRRPPHAMAQLFAEADGLLVHLKDDPLFAVTIPSKTQAYLQAGKPIIMAARGDAAEMVIAARAGYAVRPEDPQTLADAIRELKARTPDERNAMGTNGARYYADKLALPVGAQRFEHVFGEARYASRRSGGLKRLGDICISAGLLAIGAIPLALLGLLVARKLGRPVLFRQQRPGRYGKPFEILKFRTMTDARDAAGRLLPDGQRLTPFGRWLRSSSLDELPALINVLRGEMSLVGPRPLLMRYTPYLTQEERLRLVVRPGITGWAQVNGRNHTPWTERLAMDVWYVRNWSLWLDIVTLFRTVLQVIRRKDIVVDAESIMQNLDDERRTTGRDA